MDKNKNTNIHWTNHAQEKMRYYHFSEQRVKRVFNSPKRVEEGIAPNTIAMMQVAGSKKHPYEIWVMFQETKIRRKVISAWKYPGRTKPRSEIALDFLKREYSEYAAT